MAIGSFSTGSESISGNVDFVAATLAEKISATLNTASATLVSGSVSILPDGIGPTNASQPSSTQRPLAITSNGNAAMQFDGVDDFLRWPTSSVSNNLTTQMGIAFWVKIQQSTYGELFCNFSGQPNNKLTITCNEHGTGEVTVWVSPDGNDDARVASTGNAAFVVDEWTFIYLSFDGSGSTEATKLKLFMGTTPGSISEKSLTFSDSGLPRVLPESLDTSGSEWLIGALSATAPHFQIASSVGAHIWCFTLPLTSTEINQISNIDPPVAGSTTRSSTVSAQCTIPTASSSGTSAKLSTSSSTAALPTASSSLTARRTSITASSLYPATATSVSAAGKTGSTSITGSLVSAASSATSTAKQSIAGISSTSLSAASSATSILVGNTAILSALTLVSSTGQSTKISTFICNAAGAICTSSGTGRKQADVEATVSIPVISSSATLSRQSVLSCNASSVSAISEATSLKTSIFSASSAVLALSSTSTSTASQGYADITGCRVTSESTSVSRLTSVMSAVCSVPISSVLGTSAASTLCQSISTSIQVASTATVTTESSHLSITSVGASAVSTATSTPTVSILEAISPNISIESEVTSSKPSQSEVTTTAIFASSTAYSKRSSPSLNIETSAFIPSVSVSATRPSSYLSTCTIALSESSTESAKKSTSSAYLHTIVLQSSAQSNKPGLLSLIYSGLLGQSEGLHVRPGESQFNLLLPALEGSGNVLVQDSGILPDPVSIIIDTIDVIETTVEIASIQAITVNRNTTNLVTSSAGNVTITVPRR